MKAHIWLWIENSVIRNRLARYLSLGEFQLRNVDTLSEAMQLLKTPDVLPHFVICEVPNLALENFVSQLKNDSPETRLVALHQRDQVRNLTQYQNLGFFHHLEAGVDLTEQLDLVSRQLLKEIQNQQLVVDQNSSFRNFMDRWKNYRRLKLLADENPFRCEDFMMELRRFFQASWSIYFDYSEANSKIEAKERWPKQLFGGVHASMSLVNSKQFLTSPPSILRDEKFLDCLQSFWSLKGDGEGIQERRLRVWPRYESQKLKGFFLLNCLDSELFDEFEKNGFRLDFNSRSFRKPVQNFYEMVEPIESLAARYALPAVFVQWPFRLDVDEEIKRKALRALSEFSRLNLRRSDWVSLSLKQGFRALFPFVSKESMKSTWEKLFQYMDICFEGNAKELFQSFRIASFPESGKSFYEIGQRLSNLSGIEGVEELSPLPSRVNWKFKELKTVPLPKGS